MNYQGTKASSNRIVHLKIKPVSMLLILVFLLGLLSIVILTFDAEFEIHVHLMFYLYLFFWVTLFLLSYILIKIVPEGKGKIDSQDQ
jgi:hypothetical protein